MRLRGGWGGASTDWSCKLSARKARGPTGAPPKSERTNRGPPPSLRAPRDTWVPAWAPGGGAGPAAAPPRAGVKRPGGAAAARAGTRPVPSGPRLRARSPSPRHGKEREGRARRPDAGVSPASPRRTGTLGSRLCQLSGVLLPPLPGGQAPPSARGTHVGLPHPDPVSFLTQILQSRTHPPLPLGLDSSLSPLPPLLRRGGLAAPSMALFMAPSALYVPPFLMLVSPLSKSLPTTQYSRCLGGSLPPLGLLLSRPYAKYSGHLARIPGAPLGSPLLSLSGLPHPTNSGPLLPRIYQPTRRLSVGPPPIPRVLRSRCKRVHSPLSQHLRGSLHLVFLSFLNFLAS